MSALPEESPSAASPPPELRWRCRRGMRELDVLLLRWLERRWQGCGDAQQQAFRALLDCEDDELWNWLLGRSDPLQPALAGIVNDIRSVPVESG